MTDERPGSYEIDTDQVRVASGELWESGDEIAGRAGAWSTVTAGQVGSHRAADVINRFISRHAANAVTSGRNFQTIADDATVAAGSYVVTDELAAGQVAKVSRSEDQIDGNAF
ncbi:MAG: hypothetical protein ACRCY8_19730 [Dermatophilaceae bacterium]